MIYIDKPVSYLRDGRAIRAAHLISDVPGGAGTTELIAFAVRIGLRARWIQKRGTEYEHFDVMGSYITKAREAGACDLDRRRLGEMLQRKRARWPSTIRAA